MLWNSVCEEKEKRGSVWGPGFEIRNREIDQRHPVRLSLDSSLSGISPPLSLPRDSILSFCPFRVSFLRASLLFLLSTLSFFFPFLSSQNQPFAIRTGELSADPRHRFSNLPCPPQGRTSSDSRPHPPLAEASSASSERPLFLRLLVP